MLNISEEQMLAFLPKSDSDIIDFIIKHLQNESPELIDRIPEDSLKEMVGNGIKRARKYNLTALADLAGFVSIMFEIAPNFDEIPELQGVLCSQEVAPETKLSMLFEKKFNAAWEKADNSYDAEAWTKAWFPELDGNE